MSDGSTSANPLATSSSSVQVTLPSVSGRYESERYQFLRVWSCSNSCNSFNTCNSRNYIRSKNGCVWSHTTSIYYIPVTGATSYLWTVPSGATIVGASNGTSIQVNFTNSFSIGSICVAAVNSCGAGSSRCPSGQTWTCFTYCWTGGGFCSKPLSIIPFSLSLIQQGICGLPLTMD